MDSNQALQLFSKHAFKMDRPPKNYLDLSKDVIKTTGGLPLALEVIGSSLYGRGEPAWKDTVKKLAKIPANAVQKKLRISYDGLSYEEKEMFLDIACFFIGMDKSIACYIWDGCDFFPGDGVDKLCLKALVKIGEKNMLIMHDQLRDLGREIVRQENVKECGEPSRLWLHKEVLEVLSTQKGARKVEGLCITFNRWRDSHCMMTGGFDAMTKLRLLQVDFAKVVGKFMCSFPELRWLSWKGCPVQFTPTNLTKLCVLDLSNSDITESWVGWKYIKEAENLKVLNLSWCSKLSRTPDLAGNTQLEVLLLENCATLATIDTSMDHLKRLVILKMRGCKTQLPETLCHLEALTELYIDFSEIRLPSSICHLRNLKTLSTACYGDYFFVTSFKDVDLPELPPSLKYLDCSGCRMKSLPRLSNLMNLEELYLDYCLNLVELPTTINALTRLESLTLGNCHLLQCIPHLPSCLKSLNVRKCSNLREILGFSDMRNLDKLFLDECSNLEKIESFDGLDSLKQLEIKDCQSLRKLPKLGDLEKLRYLKLCGVGLSEIEGFDGLYSMEELIIESCQLLRINLNSSSSKNLLCIEIQHCKELGEIEGLKGLVSLEKLSISGCPSLRKMQLPKKLRELDIIKCGKLYEIEGLKDLESLTRFSLCWCKSIIRLPDLSNLKMLKALKIWKIYCFEGLENIEKSIIPYVSPLNNLKRIKQNSFCEKSMVISNVGRLKSLGVLFVEGCKSMEIFNIRNCWKVTEIQGIDRLQILEVLRINGCISIETLPSLSKLMKLKILSVVNCRKLTEIQGVDELESLEEFNVSGCISIETLPCLSKLTKLRILSTSGCKMLIEIQGVDELESLEKFNVNGCISIESLPCPSKLKNLRVLSTVGCKMLTKIQGVDDLESLEKFNVSGCISIERSRRPSKILRVLSTVGCMMVIEIQGVGKLESLEMMCSHSCGCISIGADPSNFKNLVVLSTAGCKMLTEIQDVDELESDDLDE